MPEVIIVGGGVAGGALATVLARAGHSALVLERSSRYRDLVRGESIVPWGVREVIRLGLLEPLLEAGGQWASRYISYDEGVDPRDAERRGLELDRLVPGVAGSLNIGHPALCQALRGTAEAAGARYLTGVTAVRCHPGPAPRVTFTHAGRAHEVSCRLIAGADGRASVARRALHESIHRTDVSHVISGLLVSGLEGIRAEAEVQAIERDVYFLGMPLRDGRARVYLTFPAEQRGRFAGAGGSRTFLEASRLGCLPASERWAAATAAGPCGTFTAEYLWPESPVSEGMVLVGDAAGYLNPLIGQGLACAFTDVRVVAELLVQERVWSSAALAPYVEERRDRFERLCAIGRLYGAVFADFRAGAPARRRAVAERLEEEPMLTLAFAAMFAGPECVPGGVDFVLRAHRTLIGGD